jgi:thioredoxin 1
MSARIQPIDSARFQTEVLDSSVPVVAIFMKEGGHCCSLMMPCIEGIASEHEELPFVALKVHECRRIFNEYCIMRYPTFIVFKDGKEISRFACCVASKDEMLDFLKRWTN